MNKYCLLSIACLLGLQLSSASAEDEGSSSQGKTLKPGILATQGSVNVALSQTGAVSVDAAPGDKANPLSTNVAQNGGRCVLTVTNPDGAESSVVSATIAVERFNKEGRKTNSNSYSFNLTPGQTEVRSFNCPAEEGMVVARLISGKIN